MTIGDLKDIAEMVGIVVAGFWTYFLFVRRRLGYPNAELEHKVEIRPLSLKDGHQRQYLIRVTVLIKNPSSVLLVFRSAEVRLSQVIPLSPDLEKASGEGPDMVKDGAVEVAFPMLGRRCWHRLDGEVEPSGTAHLIADFTAPSTVRTVEVYSHVESRKRVNNNMWDWTLTTLHETQGDSNGHRHNTDTR